VPSEPPQRKHLRRLGEISTRIQKRIFFITTCSYDRKPILADAFGAMIVDALREAAERTG
jgi:hypothetical protein